MKLRPIDYPEGRAGSGTLWGLRKENQGK